MRAKFRVESVTDFGDQKEVKLQAVMCGSQENQDFHSYTPRGALQMVIDKSGAMDYFTPGKEYYLDFTEAKENA